MLSVMDNAIGQRIKAARTNKNMTLEELGNKIGMTKSALSKVERGLVKPSPNMLHLISKALDVSFDWLTKGEPQDKDCVTQLTTIGQRIRYLRQKKGISMEELAEAINSTSGTITYWENDKRMPGAEYIIKLSEFFEVSTDWLLKGVEEKKGDIFLKTLWESSSLPGKKGSDAHNQHRYSNASVQSALRKYYLAIKNLPEQDIILLNDFVDRFVCSATNVLTRPTTEPEATFAKIPILGAAAAGQPIEAIRFLEGYISVPGDTSKYRNCFAIRVRGDSMKNAGIQDGGYVIVRQQPVVENNEIALVMIDNEVTIKRFKLVNDTAVLISENDNYKPMIYKQATDMAILGKVIKYIPPDEAEIEEALDY